MARNRRPIARQHAEDDVAPHPAADRRRTPEPPARSASADVRSPLDALPLSLQATVGNAAVASLVGRRATERVTSPQASPLVLQLGKKKGGKKEGTFIGDRAAIHVHIGIGSPHLVFQGDRYDLKGPDVGGGVYGRNRINIAIAAMTAAAGAANVSGYAACLAWLRAW